MMKLELVSTEEKGNLRREYYEIGDYKVWVDFENNKLYDICIREDHTKDYIPEICYHTSIFGNKKPELKIQTPAYGALNPEEIQKVIEAYQDALQVVEILTEKFIK